MDFVSEIGELRGNQGMEGEGNVITVEPITMIVPPELQDVPETPTPERSASSGAREGSSANPTPSSEGSSSENTASTSSPSPESMEVAVNVPPVAGWENKTIGGRLSNLRKAPNTLTAGFRFRVNLHHEVADCPTSIKGYKRLEEVVRQYHVPRTVLLRTGTKNERACSVSATGWIPVYVDHFDAGLRFPLSGLIYDILSEYELALTQLTPNSIKFIVGFMLLCARLQIPAKAIVFRSLFLCRLSTTQTRWYYISGREKMVVFKNMRNKVSRWKRQFIFVRDTRVKRVSTDLAARLSEWRPGHAYMNYPTLTPGDLELRDKITNYVKGGGLVDLEALVTPELLAMRGFVDITNLFSEGEMSSMLERQRERAQRSRGRGTGSSARRQTRFDELPLAAPRSSAQREQASSSISRPQAERRVEPAPADIRRRGREESDAEDDVPLTRRRLDAGRQPGVVRSPEAPAVQARSAAEALPPPVASGGPRITYPEGFSYTKPDCQLAMVQVKLTADMLQALSYSVALFESEQAARIQNRELVDNCKRLSSDKASLEDEVNRLQSSEMANRAASAESRADELANKVIQLQEELDKVKAEKESGIQAAMDEVVRAVDLRKKVEAERDGALNDLNALRGRVAVADQDLGRAEESLRQVKAQHQHCISIARAQGAEWLVGADMFQDAVAVASMNTTTEIYNDVRGKVLKLRPDFPINELAFFEGEEFDAEGKSLTEPSDTTVRLRWELNEEGLPTWPPSVLEEGKEFENLPRFDTWAGDAPVEEAEPSSTPPVPQPVSAVTSIPARADASAPVDLTDD
ncbi:hypothetical protein SLEP1_g55777 [Rubroshorea leprosula]|uniref:Transposase (putative) gypsy type domain-containing protein n=1 Tax=Rubroshorea leprosula TaxID=152421 RepID=A0AAV5MHK7_9ROSI|nr:hypothetical protein SLEP1_g55777 [Rubroshorea leprosula]